MAEKPKIARWATGSSDESLARALADQRRIEIGRLTQTDHETRTTPAGYTKERYDAVRSDRDDLDYREWMLEPGFSGLTREPGRHGFASEESREKAKKAKARAQLRRELEEGF